MIFETSAEDFKNLIQCSIPYSSPVLVFTVSDSAPTFLVNGSAVPKITCHIGGQTFSPVFVSPGNYKIIVTLFQSTGAWQLFRIPQKEYLNRFIALYELLGSKRDFVLDRIFEVRDNNYAVIQVIERFLSNFTVNAKVCKTCIDEAVSLIRKRNGNISVGELCANLGVNQRSMRRDFNHFTGISPKEYSRIYRLNQLHLYLMYSQGIDIQDLVYRFGYFDQSHLINDFKSYAGYSPAALGNNIVLSHFLEADNRFEKFNLQYN